MFWRSWVFLTGLPVGVLASLAWRGEPSPLELRLAALAGGLLWVSVASLFARLRDDDPARGNHLAAAGSSGLVAVPAIGACLLSLAPGAAWMLAAVGAVAAAAFYLASRRSGAAGGVRAQLRAVGLALAGGAAALATASAVIAALGAEPLALNEARAAAVYDFDARVVTRPLPSCADRPARIETLLDRGAHPRLSPDGAFVWFDALTEGGTRQVHRLERASGAVLCWTCGEPGNNLRPAIGGSGARVVFESDRHATWRWPLNTEIREVDARGASPRASSRRLTFSPGSDDHAVLGPDGRVVAWSHAEGGGFAVVTASILSGHGGVLLGRPGVVEAAGTDWVAPLAWSPDARSLVVVRGNPFRPLEAVAIDLATGTRSELEAGAAPHASAGFSADGGWLSLVATRRGRAAGLLPRGLGFALGGLATRISVGEAMFRTTALRAGEPRAPGSPIDVGDAAAWGEPTGVALEADGTGMILGQRRSADGQVEERLLQLTLRCTSATAP